MSRYQDQTLACAECGREFTWAAGEQEYFHEMKYDGPPKRCEDCRRAKRGRQGEGEPGQAQIAAQEVGGEAMSNEAGEYVLSFNVGDDPTPETPATQRCRNLYEALATASLVRKYEGRSSHILRGEKVEMDSGELEEAFARMHELEREDPGGDRQSWARQVLREMGKEP